LEPGTAHAFRRIAGTRIAHASHAPFSAHSGIARQQSAQTRRFNSCPASIDELKRHCQLFRPPDIRIPLFIFIKSNILPTQWVIIAIAFSIEYCKTAKTLLTSTFP